MYCNFRSLLSHRSCRTCFSPGNSPESFCRNYNKCNYICNGSGLIEVLCSPIIEACPFDNKEATMSLLHSFYCWGAVGTILVSTIFFAVFGIDSWKWLAVLLALIPTVNIYNFATCPIEYLVDENEGMVYQHFLKHHYSGLLLF